MPTAASSSKIRQNRLFCGVADCRASASPRQRIATLKVFSRDIFDSSWQSLRFLTAPEEQADAGQQQQAEYDTAKPRLVQPAEGFQAGPDAERQCRQSKEEQHGGCRTDRAGAAEPKRDHHESRDPNRLENGALLS